ncbi:MAG: FtsX-like permease family protein [Gammaproteobacteria bacterium]|nr:FtsX-like permease family protein [Gammaproteobacteria bacterium]MBU1554435.1 FtsX-like permease family protein [Gammaproteobacteria bacterium]MBU2070215.1 FtsX-like permease family protein [Gammaproteobacteria bacterium]MBU2183534.1 FtsX-like permease family protein [Gammaproteobacteria bacterium]MBU2206636.1 FtsX-like permease family protein [Gammaproteobacteria bacterium]
MSLYLLFKGLLSRKVVTILLLLQLAMTLALLLNSVLLAQQTHKQLNQPTGMDLDNIVLVQLKPTTASLRVYPALEELLNRQLNAVSALPDVVAAAYANQSALLQGGNNGNVYLDGEEGRTNQPSVPMYFVSKEFFRVLDSQVLQGELPQHSVSLDNPVRPDVVITQSLAKQLFADKSAIGQQLNRGRLAAVISDFYGQRSGDNVMYNSIQVAPPYGVDWGYSILLRVTPGRAGAVRQQLDQVLRQVEPNIEIFHIRTLAEQHQRLYRNEYGLAMLLTILSALMLLVTMVSSYSSTHFHALKRQQEIGIKRALGASKNSIFIELLSENWLCTLVGALFGVVLALLLNQALAQVISIPSLNGYLPVMTIMALLLCVTLATWYPAAIATRISPASATKAL